MEQNQIDPKLIAKYVMAYSQQQDNLIKFQLDASPELYDFFLDLLGLEENEEGILVRSKFKERLINEQGASTLLSFLKPRITKIISLSNIDDKDIRKRCECYMNDLTWLLGKHKDEFEIKSLQVMNSIIELCDDIFFTTMNKSKEAGERDTLRKQFTHVESSEKITQQQQKPQTQFFSNPFKEVRR